MHLSTDDFKMARGSRLLPLAVLLLLTLSLLWYTKSRDGLSYLKGHGYNYNPNPAANFKSPTKDSVKDVHNSTLGVRSSPNLPSPFVLTCLAPQFQKVFVLNLAERPDKLDAFALASTLTGFTAEIIQGVRGEEVVDKALPSLEGLPEVLYIRSGAWALWLTGIAEGGVEEQCGGVLACPLEFCANVSQTQPRAEVSQSSY